MTKICQKCNRTNDETSKFCGYCGNKFAYSALENANSSVELDNTNVQIAYESVEALHENTTIANEPIKTDAFSNNSNNIGEFHQKSVQSTQNANIGVVNEMRIETSDYFSDEYINLQKLFIVKDCDYYIEKFKVLREKNSYISFNYKILFTLYFWLIDRRQYKAFFTLYGIAFMSIIAYVLSGFNVEKAMFAIFMSALVYVILYLVLTVVYSFIGNYMYMKTIDKYILKYRTLSGDEAEKYLKKHAGPDNWLHTVVFTLFLIAKMLKK